MAASTKKTSGSSKRKTTAKKRTGKASGRRPDKRTVAKKKRFITNEIEVIAFSFFALFLLLSNFGLTGRIGELASSVETGLMGIIGYVFPVILAAAVYIYCRNKNAVFARAKLLVTFLTVLILSALMHLLFGVDLGFDIVGYYDSGAAGEPGGGAFGGIIAGGLTAVAGTVGAYLILVVLLIVSMVFVTERSFVNAVRQGSERTVEKARVNHERFRESMELRREERIRRREEALSFSGDDGYIDSEYDDYGDGVKPIYAGFGEDIIGDSEAGYAPGYGYEDELDEAYDEGYSEGYDSDYDEGYGKAADPASEFHGSINLPESYDYDDDSVPFEESADDKYKVYRNGRNASLQNTTESGQELCADDAVREGYAVSVGVRTEAELPEISQEKQELDEDYSDIMSFRRPADRAREAMAMDMAIDTSATDKASDMQDSGEASRAREAKAEPERASKNTAEENLAVASEIEKEEPVRKPYVFPPVNLLKKGTGRSSFDQKELRDTAVKLQQTLKTFGVGVTVTNVACGPSVTRYELTLEQGVKVSKITSLADDIKYALAAEEIRIEAPIPGKSAVGIEVPNKDNSIVYFRDIIDTDEFRSFKSKLAFGVGKDIGGQTVITDLAKMPHVLIAGATGSGKSVCINTLIMSLIYKASPDEVRMIMVDPKVVELSVYNGIPHLLIPVVTDPKKAAAALNWAVAEMTDRYKKFAETGTRDLKGYNKRVEEVCASKGIAEEEKPRKLPQIVIIIDELADLMMVASSEVEASIIRLAQLARAAGIHLVIATQRPSVNVITGLIKANVPSRIAFKVSSGVDSRTILDMNGAEKLLGYGDMLFFPSGAPKPSRIQGSFISDSEVQVVVDFLKKEGEASYSDEIESSINTESQEGENSSSSKDRDEYFEQAGRLIIEKDKASIGMLQRMYKIGFNRAARIMDQLAEAGVVGPEEGTKPRRVLMSAEEFERIL